MAVIQKDVAGIYRKEIDESNNLTVVGTSVGAIVVRASKGPINREVIISDYPKYVDTFGSPFFSATDNPVFGYGAYAAEEFLKESNELHVVRVIDETDEYPDAEFLSTFDVSSTWESTGDWTNDGISASMTPNVPDSTTVIQALDKNITAGSLLLVGALGPGIDGNNLGVTIETFNTSCDWMLNYDDYPTASAVGAIISSATAGLVPTITAFSAALNTAGYGMEADVFPVATKVMKINVYTKKTSESWEDINTKLDSADLTIADLTPVEQWYGTIGFVKDARNKQLRLKETINGNSSYIYVVTGSNTFPYEVLPANTAIFNLGGGAVSYKDGTGANDGTAVSSGWDFFVDREYTSVNILVNPDWNTTIKQKVAGIAASRMDCIATGQVAGLSTTTVAGVLAAEQYGYSNPSYMGLYAGWDLRYDQANDRNVYIPKACFAGALYARVDRTGNTWDAPAGDPNGIIPTLGQNKIFTFTEIGQLQKAGINTTRWLKSSGHTMWGQRTAQIKNTALNRISTRRLLLFIENSIEATMNPFIFNIVNDDRTRLRVSTLINGFLSSLKSGSHPGVTDATCVCTEQNNTPDVIDAEQMILDIFVVPAKPVEVIQINTRIMKTGVNFSEVIL